MESERRRSGNAPVVSRAREARTHPPGPPSPRSTYHCHPLVPVPFPRDSRPLVANPLSAPRNVNSRRFNSYEYFPRAWDDRGVAEKTRAEDEEAEEEDEEAEGRNRKKDRTIKECERTPRIVLLRCLARRFVSLSPRLFSRCFVSF